MGVGQVGLEDDAGLEAVMRSGVRRIAYHSEDEYRLQARKALFAKGDPHARHAEWRDEETAFLGTRRLMAIARKTHRPAHILHVSTAEELRAENRSHRILSVDEAVAFVKAGAPLGLHPLIGGLPPELAWKYLNVVVDKVMPALQA